MKNQNEFLNGQVDFYKNENEKLKNLLQEQNEGFKKEFGEMKGDLEKKIEFLEKNYSQN